MIEQNFWKNKKVFLTGHTGFKGCWLSIWLHKMGANVTGFALNLPTEPSLFSLAKVNDLINDIRGDIRDINSLQRCIKETKPEIVIHMAAQPIVRESYKNPVDTYATNVMGTVNLLESIRRVGGVKAIVNVTTDKCYENREWVWGYRESEAMGGYDPYSSSKGCSELVTAAYRQSFFNPHDYTKHGVALASARAGNVIGGGDWASDRLIPDIIRALLKKEPVQIRNPHAIRPWQHVLEPLSGYLTLAQKLYIEGPRYAEGWNFGPEDSDAKPVEWIVKHLCEIWGNGASYVIDKGEHPHEAHFLKLDCSKAHSLLGWKPQWRLETALHKIVEWTKAFISEHDLKIITEKQIESYMLSN